MAISFDQKLSMLIVDGNEVDRTALKRSLTQTHLDLSIDEALDADTALAALQQTAYDCVFLDYHLPGKNGLQLTQEIRGQGIEVPVIVMTSQGDEPTAVELMKAGASDYLPKRKLSSEVLARLIYSAIRMHQAEALVESFNQHIIEKNILLRRQNQELARQQRYIYQQNLKLQEVSRLKSEFLATISHELRTPLNAVIGFSQILLSSLKGTTPIHKQRDMLGRILSNGQSLLELIDDILAFSKLEAGRLSLKPETLNIAALVNQTVEELRSLAAQKSLWLETDITLDNPIVVNDAAMLRQVTINLLSNAIKFTDAGSIKVLLSDQPVHLDSHSGLNLTACHNSNNSNPNHSHPNHSNLNNSNPNNSNPDMDSIILSVIDTGCGIKAENQTCIFDPFHQADQKVTRQHSGTGLGLAITQSIVKIMHGNITLTSQVGKGSNFTVELPRTVLADPQTAETSECSFLDASETSLSEANRLYSSQTHSSQTHSSQTHSSQTHYSQTHHNQ